METIKSKKMKFDFIIQYPGEEQRNFTGTHEDLKTLKPGFVIIASIRLK